MFDDYFKYTILLFLVFSWTLTPFCKKKAIGKLNNEEYFVVNFILTALLAFIFWMYLLHSKKTDLNIFTKMSLNEIVWAIGAAFLSIVSALCLIVLIKNYEVSHIMPQLNPCVIILTTLMGVLLFGEKFSILKGIGIMLIILGLVIISKTN